MQITPDINSLPIELICSIFCWIPVQHVFTFRRLCRAVNDSLLTTQFAVLNMQLPSKLSPCQTHESIWLLLPDKYQAVVAGKMLSQLESMDIFVFSKTRIPFPKSVVLLSKLTTGTVPDFSNLNALTHLMLENNQLKGPILTTIGSPSKLTAMHLDHNQFSSIPSTIANLANLSYIDISNNPISGDLLSDFWHLRKLRIISMAHCGVTGSIAGIGALSCFQVLDATHNDLTGGIPPNELSQLTQLRSLHLFGNPRLNGQLWDFTRLDSFKYLCVNSGVLENSTLCGAFRSCQSHGERQDWQDSDSDSDG